MPHVIEPASTGRASCRACQQRIAAGELRLGERVPNPYGDEGTETTHWYHVPCAAFTRPQAFLEASSSSPLSIDRRAELEAEAAMGVQHERLARVRAAERAPTGRATCRHCHELIGKGAWRIALAYFEDGRFTPAGYVHLACARPYLDTAAILPRIAHFSPALEPADLEKIEALLRGPRA